MKKREIKILKRDALPTPPPPPTTEELALRQIKSDADDQQDLVDNVKNWISERSENSKAEDIDSKKRLFAWEGDNLIKSK